MDHFLTYVAATLIVWLAWPRRPFVVGGVLMASAILLEALQALTPDRQADFQAGLFGAVGALTAALLAELLTRVWSWRIPLTIVKIAGSLAVIALAVLSLVPRELRPHTGAPGPVEHLAAYAIVGALLAFGYHKRSQPFIIALSLLLYASILEIAQIWVPGRNPTVVDFAASSAGALIGSAFTWVGFRATNALSKYRSGKQPIKIIELRDQGTGLREGVFLYASEKEPPGPENKTPEGLS
jgi:VanZ family protein